MRWQGVFVSVLLAALTPVAVSAQAVVSAHAGVLNFSDGEVFLDDQPVQQKAGVFSTVKEGSVLRTGKGRAEVLLTPGVFLRIDEQSSFRMLSTDLSKPRLEVLRGSAIVDSNETTGANPLVLTFKSYDLRFPKPGVYRLDSEPGVFETYTGEAEVSTKGEPVKKIDESHQFFFGIGTETKKYGDGAVDEFSEWARNRATTITADNQTVAQSTADPGNSPDPGDYGSVYGAPGAGTPSFGGISPAYGTYAGPMLFDNGFYSGPPFFNTFFQPVAVIYLVPWWWRKPPVKSGSGRPPSGTPGHGTGIPVNTLTARKLGYPTLPSSDLNSFRPAEHQSYSARYGTLSPVGYGTLFPSRSLLYGYPSPLRLPSPVRINTPPRVSVGSSRAYTPRSYAPAAAPRVSAPMGIRR